MTVYVVRHASAGDRYGYRNDDLERPLDERGQRQAQAVADALGDALDGLGTLDQPVRLLSSRAVRCHETLAPLAARLGVEIESHAAFTEGANRGDTAVAMVELVDKNAVIASHGDVIPELIRQLMLDGMRVVGGRGCEKASIWELETVGRDYVRARYHGVPQPPPDPA